jgi:hypothetical protein
VKNFVKSLNSEKFIEYQNLDFEHMKVHFEELMSQPREIFLGLEKARMQKTYLAYDHVKLLEKLVMEHSSKS